MTARDASAIAKWIEEHCLTESGEPVRLVPYQRALLDALVTGSMVAVVAPRDFNRTTLLGWVAAADQAGVLEATFGPRPGQARAVAEAARRQPRRAV